MYTIRNIKNNIIVAKSNNYLKICQLLKEKYSCSFWYRLYLNNTQIR